MVVEILYPIANQNRAAQRHKTFGAVHTPWHSIPSRGNSNAVQSGRGRTNLPLASSLSSVQNDVES